ncbi:ABC transporter ATP-binding protein [Maricaulis sp. MIT060901]|uniref:ABC transporter ATP-binding protein n=1 Tax=Maricaulis sp. MIT060901 TaxID=3096993 RepID=UPI0039994928
MSDTNPDSAQVRPSIAMAWSHGVRTAGLVWSSQPWLIICISILTVVVALLPAAALYMSRLIVDSVVAAIESGASADRDAALMWVRVEAAILAVLLAARRLLAFERSRLQVELGYATNQAILGKCAALDLEQIERADLQQQLVIAKQFTTSRPYNLVSRGFDLLQHALTLVSVAVLLWAFSPLLLAFIVAGALPLFLGNLRFADTAFGFYKGRTPEVRERSYLESLITGEGSARDRLHYRLDRPLQARYRELFQSMFQRDLVMKGRHAFWGAVLAILSTAVFLGAKVWIVWVTISGAITLGQMTMFVGLVKQGQASVTSLLAAFNGVVEDVLYLSTLYGFLDTPVEARASGVSVGETPGDGLRFEHVSYRYPNGPRLALDDVTFHVPGGSALGIVGVNGSGKSTLIKLALGLYRPLNGKVLLDGTDLADWDREALARRFGVLFQPSTNFKMTARDNIEVGVGLAPMSDEALARATELGLADEVIADLPEGYNSRLSKRFVDGIEMSGGQWKRLALARAYANPDADCVILDEPTAALDANAEAELLKRPRDGTGLIIISHRLSNLRPTDQIIMLEKGRLIEQGDHDALVEKGGAYATMFNVQAKAHR